MNAKRRSGWQLLAIAMLLAATAAPASAAAGKSAPAGPVREWTPTSTAPVMSFGQGAGKTVVDTLTLMGPGGVYPYRGDFETASPRPIGEGRLTDGWTTVDYTAPINGWHVDTWRNPFTGRAAWCGDLGIPSCGSDPAGGYNNRWYCILEFRKTVGAGPATVRVQANVQYDCEAGYDYLLLQRRTAAAPAFEPTGTGQGLSWDGIGTTTVDYTFTWTAAELLGGTDIAIAFVFDADDGWSDGDCQYPSDGAARVDDITVTVNGTTTYSDDFEDGSLGPDWSATPNQGVGDFARVWDAAGDLDECASNYSKLVAFLDDGLVVPGTGGTPGAAGLDYGPGGWVVNGRGGLLGTYNGLDNSVLSPVMNLPDPTAGGLTVAFDVYRHETYASSSAGIFYTWDVRSAANGDITQAPWVNRNFVYYGGPAWVRAVNEVGDLLIPGATQVQVRLSAMQFTWFFCYGCGWGIPTPAPYFDNVNVKSYRGTGPRIVVTDTRLANDTFPASGALDLANLGANSCRFDMAASISARTHLRNDPGDSIWVDVTPRSGGTLSTPVMNWAFAAKNPLFTDAHRTALAAGQTSGTVAGRVTRTAAGSVVANRYNFDLPDTGMLFPGDVLHYYFAASDVVAGDTRTATAPADLAGYGAADASVWPWLYTVNCLPSVSTAQGAQPPLLLWNDAGNRGNDDEWNGALRSLCMRPGIDYDVFNTHGAASGVGNGLGGRASAPQINGYGHMLYTCGDLGAYTLSNGDLVTTTDAGNDIGLLQAWLAPGGRDLVLAGDDLAATLAASGPAGASFLSGRLGVSLVDGDVRNDIGGQVAPRVVSVPGNTVTSVGAWIDYGGCATINDFDHVVPLPGAERLAQFTANDGVSTPYAASAATLNISGTNRIVSLPCDLSYIYDAPGWSESEPTRVHLLANFLGLVPVAGWGGCASATPPVVIRAALAVSSHPNPFNPSVTLEYALPASGAVAMKVFDARGRLVRTLIDGPVAQATGTVTWNGRDDRGAALPSGLYFVETRAGDQVDVRKVTMLK